MQMKKNKKKLKERNNIRIENVFEYSKITRRHLNFLLFYLHHKLPFFIALDWTGEDWLAQSIKERKNQSSKQSDNRRRSDKLIWKIQSWLIKEEFNGFKKPRT